MGFSEAFHQTDTVGSESWVFSALRGPLKPVLTKMPPEKSVAACEGDDELATTPKSEESRIPRSLICPPAPKKRKSAPSKKSCRVREFFNPPDLESIFIRRVEGARF
ncbi:Unknown protein [Striga hermonthica]|uniref:Cyclin-dependent protein kinase inhibitor SMR6 n=1 Tax=Striga hermonthica TaxID=68872 RepID=A0A9N7NF77_STRHE|nr:Unknown protein [Striga hermonthica]